ncbi:CRISPR-associated CARF protein Csx1 [Staphylothermus hellenicus]|uniref:CRISPR-associated protein DxTHG motif protein n=1 Tax=Staphylothermus hellenicus (strain DSM 12710 / JCM 10830 / BK20S6-10-b1 / P8) TaxID=591019 RepID=D7DAW0_STAHD|nr:CRISPR-associated CARF protein Csx1 [Staphylothermus hellenicus]ADI31307.1 CRISPR-associated protein DxTHG motif protein [Staphylothermus hellenicus DSM 12710]
MNSSSFRVLVVAPWGYPKGWDEAKYCLRKASDRGIDIGGCCISCSSSLTLYLLLKSYDEVDDARLLIIGSDTVIKPDINDLRGNVEKWFYETVKDLFNRTKCDGLEKNPEWVNDIYVGVVPGIGEYHGYYFKGDIIKMFLESYRNIVLNIESFKPSVIVLDTTHGLNILTIATLYATVAASIVYGKKIYTFNSEPYPPGRRAGKHRQLEKSEKLESEEKQIQDVPSLNIHNISLLQKIIDFLRALDSLRYLSEKQLNKLLKGLREKRVHDKYVELMDKTVCMVEALRSGLLGLLYSNSKLSNGRNIPFTVNNIYNSLKKIYQVDYNRPWITPDITDNTVEYRSLLPEELAKYIPILDFLQKYMVEEYSRLLNLEPLYLKEFAKHVSRILDRNGYWDRKQIIIKEASELTETACEASKDTGREIIDAKLLKEYWAKKKGIQSIGNDKIVDPRNFVAHAALNHNIIKYVKVEWRNHECGIIEVEYDYNKLVKTLKNIGGASKIHECIR